MFRCISILLFCTVLIACSNPGVRREEYLAEHPEWDDQTVLLIREGMVRKGMTQDQVRAAWGRPCWECTGTTKGDWGEAWEYATQMVYFDGNGMVTRWTGR